MEKNMETVRNGLCRVQGLEFEKKRETTLTAMGYIGTTIRINSCIPS